MNNLAQARRCVLYARLSVTKEESVITRVSKTVMPVRVRTGQVYSDSTDVFAIDDYGNQAVLSSSLHQLWAITYGSGMRNDPRYTPSDVFETFPRPTTTAALVELGQVLHSERREIMTRRDLGLTKLYNLVNSPDVPSHSDPDVGRMREIHVELDHAVIDAYGWGDIETHHGVHVFRKMQRWTVGSAARIELLDRLLEENHTRYSKEANRSSLTSPGAAGDEVGNGVLFR